MNDTNNTFDFDHPPADPVAACLTSETTDHAATVVQDELENTYTLPY